MRKIYLFFRHFKKDGFFSLINVFGLAIGFSACLLISMFVIDEYGYDKYNKNFKNIYRIVCDIHINGNSINGNFAPPPLGPALVKDFPKIKNFVRIRKIDEMLVRKGEGNLVETNAVLADSTFFNVFTLPLLSGDAKSVLKEPHSIVLTQSMAQKYFGNVDVVGKSLLVDNENTYKITGVMKDIPRQSHFHFDFIKSLSENENINRPGLWINPFASTYLLTNENVTEKELNQMIAADVYKYVGGQLKQDMNTSFSELDKNGDHFNYSCIPLGKIRLNSSVTNEFENNGNIQTIYIFIAIAVIILVIGCVNFVNLATAKSAQRAKEVGIRKVLGSSKTDLIYYFLTESLITTLIAALVSIVFTLMLLPYFNVLADKQMPIFDLVNKDIIALYLSIIIIVGFAAGSYPAFFLSSFQAVRVLNGDLRSGFKSGWLRNSLIVFQFSIAFFLIVGTLVIFSQLNYIGNHDIGYNRNQVLIVKNTNNMDQPAKLFKDAVTKLPDVIDGTMTRFLPNKITDGGGRGYFKDATMKASNTYLLGKWTIESNYIPMMGMTIAEGRNFSPEMPTDSSSILINQTAAELLGYGKNTIGQELYLGNGNNSTSYKIIGIVKDFNDVSLHNKISPIVFHLGAQESVVSFKIRANNLNSLLKKVSDIYLSMAKSSKQPFAFSFMDDDFDNLYRKDRRISQIYSAFTLLAILIASLGLFGLVSYATQQRVKEIGIRKILGSSEISIVGLLLKDVFKLVLLSVLIGCPIAWVVMNKWLQGFAYRTSIHWWIFPIAAIGTLIITISTVIWLTLNAAKMNPVLTLRKE